jgi:TIR domain
MDIPKLFLSYNSIDRSSVLAVQKLLGVRGITTFLDRDQLVSGLPWPQELEEGLRGVSAVAVFIGHDLGGWQKREMWFALDRQVREKDFILTDREYIQNGYVCMSSDE